MSVSPGFLVLMGFLFYLDEGSGLLLWALLACGLHEFGHMLAIRCLGGRICWLKLTAVGAELGLDYTRPLSYGREVAAAAAGPAVNLLVALIAAKTHFYLLAGLSLGLGLFNLLPILPLDGGRCLLFGLSACINGECAGTVLRLTSGVTTGLLFGIGLILAEEFGNITLLLTSFWLLIGLLDHFRGKRLEKHRII